MQNTPTNKPQLNHELVSLEPIDMHGPVETAVVIHVMVPGKGKARLSFAMEAGRIPMQGDFMAVLDNALTPESLKASGIPVGTRLMTKAEFVAHYTQREVGTAMALPGNPEFVRPAPEIPRGMLIHAIHGRGFLSEADALHWTNGGLAKFSGNQHNPSWDWNEKLEDLTDAQLMAIYQRTGR